MMVKILTGALAAAALTGAVLVAGLVPVHVPSESTVEHQAVTPVVQPVACPGPLTVPVGDISSGNDTLDSASADVKYDVLMTGSPQDVGDGVATDSVAGATLESVGGGDIAGLAAVSCTRPSLDQWLVGGATTLGASARLVLTNPADAPVEATVTAYGAIGAIEEPIIIVVGPMSQQSVLLEGVIPENAALVLNVEASGTGIAAAVQDSRLDGFEPVGTDWVGPGADPSESLVIPAIGPSDPTADGGSAFVSLMAPEGATVQLTLITDSGIVDWPGTSGLVLKPGVVTEIPVPEFESGAIEVKADFPVVAAGVSRVARESQTGRAGSVAFDSMWVAGQSPSTVSHSLVAVTDSPVLSVYSAVHQSVSVTNQDGKVVATGDIPARTVQLLTVDAVAGDVLTVDPGFAWAEVVRTDEGLLTALGPTETTVADLDVAVRVDGYIPVP